MKQMQGKSERIRTTRNTTTVVNLYGSNKPMLTEFTAYTLIIFTDQIFAYIQWSFLWNL